jgi:hypothetical protein
VAGPRRSRVVSDHGGRVGALQHRLPNRAHRPPRRGLDPRTTPGKTEPVHEIAGIPVALIEHYSRRRNRLYAAYETLIAAYRAEHGRDPAAAVCHKLARQATLDTRRGKKPPRSLSAMRTEWARQLTDTFGPDALRTVMAAIPEPQSWPEHDPGVPADAEVAAMASTVLTAVAEQRATWTEWNVHAEAERLLRTQPHPTDPAHHPLLVNRIVTAALAPGFSIGVDAPSLVDEPDVLRRADGTSVFRQHRAARYTSQQPPVAGRQRGSGNRRAHAGRDVAAQRARPVGRCPLPAKTARRRRRDLRGPS